MERFILFAGDNYYPAGGANDMVGDFGSMAIAIATVRDIRADWWNILDTKTGQTYNNFNKCDLLTEEE